MVYYVMDKVVGASLFSEGYEHFFPSSYRRRNQCGLTLFSFHEATSGCHDIGDEI